MSTAKVFVGSLPPGCKPEELRHLFTNYGVVVECDIMNRCGFVHLETIEMAEEAIAALNGIEFKGQTIVVEPGRPKDRRGGGGGVGGGGGGGSAGNRRPMQQGHGGGSFNRGGGHTGGNNFRAGGGSRSLNSNESQFGPMRNEGNFRQQRNAPYSKVLPQQNQNFDGPAQPYKNKFNQGLGQMGHNDFYAGNIGSAGAAGAHRSGGSHGPSNNIGQDRRGFALPAVEHQHQQQQQLSFGAKQSRFGNGTMVPSGNNADGGMYQRNRHNSGINSGSTQSGRGGFNANRGGFAGRGGFSARRGGGPNGPSSSMSQNFNKHGPANGHTHNSANAYHSDFPPLGGSHGSGGGPVNRNRFNGPRPAHNMSGNRRF
ncbi:uncharacterized protein [Drosophila virilis]|uniref:RRM domain-containing protein n=1 Tax=Drosophila virilis TaxID=7244 RepID=B4MBA5_DROVI|nr:probable H/ACA ribonucleoprotein complex subunit 1 [Drosophila virilis]EDW58376.1 uncharacterized protein Dvir_GJ14327 [Drosophila virilis]